MEAGRGAELNKIKLLAVKNTKVIKKLTDEYEKLYEAYELVKADNVNLQADIDLMKQHESDSLVSSRDKEFVAEVETEISKPETQIVTRSKVVIEDKSEDTYIAKKVVGKTKLDDILPSVETVEEIVKKPKVDEPVTAVPEPIQEGIIKALTLDDDWYNEVLEDDPE
ncbi:hypothetical protein QVD17_19576 [Tagetes erecta]|uniref:Uncharacterized protein n=1 Tax=Tagetes erecta TaxID=13708 RepID=A0AAD8KJU7_TARER|nr:hypothetical protein QVD17_19576 [Tagetes erecta]